jgi:uracil-DNA glycosylase
LLPQVLACRICETALPRGPRPVLQIHGQAKILIAGQAPGRRVHESGIPFDDASGERLRDWLGVDRATFYNPRGDLPPRPECAPAWRSSLMATLRHLELTLVLGQYAQAHHLGAAPGSVTELVQAWRSFWPSHLPLPHPSPRNQLWVSRNPWFLKDVVPALRRRVKAIL